MEDADAFYGLLQVDRQATAEAINNSYKRLGLLYHPDKHTDESKKRQAQALFNKVKRARDVLIDPHKRAVYDTLGERGLEEIEGKELVPLYSKTPREIREEYERLVKERDERRLQQSLNPKGILSVGINATDIFDHYEDALGISSRSGLASIEISSMSIQQSVEAPVTDKDTVIVSGHLNSQNGAGRGSISAVYRRITSVKGWMEAEVSGGNGLSAALRGFRTLGRHSFCNIAFNLHGTKNGFVQPGIHAIYAYQFDRNLQGRLNWSIGLENYMSTSVQWDSLHNHVAITGQLGLPNSFASATYVYSFGEDKGKIKITGRIGTLGTSVEYGFDAKVSSLSHLGASVLVGTPIGVLLKLKLTRGNQIFVFPIHLSEDVLPSAAFYGTVLPAAAYVLTKVFVVAPFLTRQKESELKKKQQEHAERLAQRRRDAAEEVQLMKATVTKNIEQEEQRGGLVIVKALYGKLVSESRASADSCIDVCIPLQTQVKNSKLILPSGVSKMSLPGFYDPCYAVDKALYVRYLFRNQLHQVTVGDTEALIVPQQGHLITSDSDSMR